MFIQLTLTITLNLAWCWKISVNGIVFSPHEDVIPRIYNGKEAKIEEVPYAVYITFEKIMCTGSIIDKLWVLTAAHCLSKNNETLMVFAGFDNKKQIKNAQARKAIRQFHHEDYISLITSDASYGGHDIAVIEVDKAFELNKKVAILKLSDEVWPIHLMHNRPCLAVGWGGSDLKQKIVPSKLQKLEVIARHGEKGCPCARSFQDKRMVCLKGNQGKGICTGDSGSALVCDKKGVGVAHMIFDANSCNPMGFGLKEFSCQTSVGTYMFICPYLDWIKKYVPSVPRTPQTCKGFKLISNKTIILLIFIHVFY